MEHSRSLSWSLRLQDATSLLLLLVVVVVVVVLLVVVLVVLGGKAGAAATRARISKDGVKVDHGERAVILEAVRVHGEEVAHRAAHGLEALQARVGAETGEAGGGS